MSWSVAFRARQYLKGSLWFVPLIGALLGVVLGSAAIRLEDFIHLPSELRYSADTSTTVLSAIVGSMVGLLGFVVTISVLVVQSATNTLSPRFMRIWYRDRLQKVVLAVFIGTLTFSYSLLRQLGTGSVPNLGVTLAGIAVAVSLVLLTVYLDRFTHILRPVACGALVAETARGVFEAGSRALHEPSASDLAAVSAPAPTVIHSTRAGAIQAIDARGMLRLARSHDCAFHLCHAVGDFVPSGAQLVEIHGGRPPKPERVAALFVLGRERTIDQDPAFGLRIMVDIAIKALSPAVNDPTTALQLLDYIEDLLALIGSRELHGREVLRDDDGTARVVLPTRTWDDMLELGVTEIRRYGTRSMQVCRRLRALLETLRSSVRERNRPAVEAELHRLDRAVAAAFADEDERAYAMRADRQGIGGPAEIGEPA